VFTARYGQSPYVKQTTLRLPRLNSRATHTHTHTHTHTQTHIQTNTNTHTFKYISGCRQKKVKSILGRRKFPSVLNKVNILWYMTSCRLLISCRRFGRSYCLHKPTKSGLPYSWRQQGKQLPVCTLPQATKY